MVFRIKSLGFRFQMLIFRWIQVLVISAVVFYYAVAVFLNSSFFSKSIDVEQTTMALLEPKPFNREYPWHIKNLPHAYSSFPDTQGFPKYFKIYFCSPYPHILDLKFANTYWQLFRYERTTFNLYGAYFDNRGQEPVIRILSMMNVIRPNIKLVCQIWLDQDEPVFGKVTEYTHLWNEDWGMQSPESLHPYLITCGFPNGHFNKIPKSVSLVKHECDAASNNLRIYYNDANQKQNFGVCVKGLDFLDKDISIKLIEWIELLKLLGADKIFAYEFAVHQNVKKVLRYYQRQNFLDVTKLTLPSGQPDDAWIRHFYMLERVGQTWMNEVIPLNDCFYRNMYNFKHIVIIDIDEIIFPLNHLNWKDMMMYINVSTSELYPAWSSFNFRQVRFQQIEDNITISNPDIPPYFNILQRVIRPESPEDPDIGTKSFHNPQEVLAVHNHLPLICLNGECNNYQVPTDIALLQHYRDQYPSSMETSVLSNKTIVDKNIWRFKTPIIKNCQRVFRELKLNV